MANSIGQRFTALDVFRGMTICLMIIVNFPGGGVAFSPLEHAQWNGFTPTDLVFPSFLFAVGNAMSFVMMKWSHQNSAHVLVKIFKRTFLIFLIGYLLNWFPFVTLDASGHVAPAPFADTRVFGVLQRIALAYCAASLMIWFWGTRAATIISAIILILYWPLMYYFGEGSDPLGPHTNAVLTLDRWLLGENHLYHGDGFAFDPEGLLSTFPSIVNVVAGYLVGDYVQKKGKTFEGLAKLLIAGFICFIISYWWNLGFPINKKLWTSSFVMHTIGLDCMILACIIYWLDFRHKTNGIYFFQVFGRNPLFIYILSDVLALILYLIPIGNTPLFLWAYPNVFSHVGPYLGSLLFAITYMLLCWCFGYVLDKRKIYLRI